MVCETIHDEYEAASSKCGFSYKTHWTESGLHNYPEKLRSILQQTLNCVTAPKVLRCFYVCGNSVVGLETRDLEMVIPRVDDCISLFLGSLAKRMEISAAHASCFLTTGWLRGERNIYV